MSIMVKRVKANFFAAIPSTKSKPTLNNINGNNGNNDKSSDSSNQSTIPITDINNSEKHNEKTETATFDDSLSEGNNVSLNMNTKNDEKEFFPIQAPSGNDKRDINVANDIDIGNDVTSKLLDKSVEADLNHRPISEISVRSKKKRKKIVEDEDEDEFEMKEEQKEDKEEDRKEREISTLATAENHSAYQNNQSGNTVSVSAVNHDDDDNDVDNEDDEDLEAAILAASLSNTKASSKINDFFHSSTKTATQPLPTSSLSSSSFISCSNLGTPNYDPIKDACWKFGELVPYAALSSLFQSVEKESSRLIILSLVSDFFRSVIALSPDSLLSCLYLCCNSIAPAYEGKELGIGDAILLKSIAESTGLTAAKLKEALREEGDLGQLALKSRTKQVTLFAAKPLTVKKVFETLKEIAAITGKNGGKLKEGKIRSLLVSCKGEEAKFIIRSLQGNLRIGLAEKSVISALARALIITPPNIPNNTEKDKPKSQFSSSSSSSSSPLILDIRKTMSETKFSALLIDSVRLLNQAYIEVPNLDRVVTAILDYGMERLPDHCYLTPGIPVKVMLGKPTTDITQILDRFTNTLFTLEFKYDGERAQIHLLKNGSIHIYSRNSENHTGKYPDLIARLPTSYDDRIVKEFIIDCECVAWDRKTKMILPFQTLSHRKRKDVSDNDITVQVALFAFDLLYLNGESYLKKTFRERRQTLWENFRRVEGEFHFAEQKDTSTEFTQRTKQKKETKQTKQIIEPVVVPY